MSRSVPQQDCHKHRVGTCASTSAFGIHAGEMWRWHRSAAYMIEDIIDPHVHEYANAFIPPGIPDAVEERWAPAFERAGAWTRRW